MQHTLTFDPEESLFTVTTEGDGDVEGVMAFLQDLIDHPQWQPGGRVLLDHRNLMIEHIDQNGVEAVSKYFRGIGPQLGDGKIALVMNREVDFGIARAWELITSDNVEMAIRVCRSLDDAKAWLAE